MPSVRSQAYRSPGSGRVTFGLSGMTIWVDAQLSPSLAKWITETFGIPAQAVRELGLRDAKDLAIFQTAREADAVILTKDADFLDILHLHGAPPRLTYGNTSNQNVRLILSSTLPEAIRFLEFGEKIVEITGSPHETRVGNHRQAPE